MVGRLSILFVALRALSLLGQNAVLDQYVREGLKNNLALRQKTFSYERSMAALKEARGLFLPSINLEARYSRAGGGRVIELPIGDLMNPVYRTLNGLLQSVGQPALFPTDLPNETFPFLRKEEQETKVRIIQPVFQPAMVYNYQMKRELQDLEEASRDTYARQLVSDIQTAYFNYLKTVRLTIVLDNTERLLLENLRITRRLSENGKATEAAVYRADAELQAFLQQKVEAEKNRNLAASYFNFLLNRSLESPIQVPLEEQPEKGSLPSPEAGEVQALQNREEFRQLRSAIAVLKTRTRLSQTAFLPGIAAVVDYGYQGEMYRFKPQDDYWMASLVASWNLFGGFQDKYKIDQARLEQKEAESRLEEVRSQIRLQVREAYQNLLVADKSLEAAQAREKSARKSYESVDRRYREGMAPQIEYLDARNALTLAEVNAIVTLYDRFIRSVEYDRITAVVSLEKE